MTALVFRTKYGIGWPIEAGKPGAPDVGAEMPLEAMLTEDFKTDAHLVAYRDGADRPLYRLKIDSIAAGSRPLMRLAVFDIDGPKHAAAADWWLAEKVKIAQLLAAVPGLFVYRTKGGYRIVGRLAEPFPITAPSDPTWKLYYWRALLWLVREFGIVGDPACADWTRLYRVPHATRDGKLQRLETIGNAAAVAPWPAIEAEPAVELETAKRIQAERANDKTQSTWWQTVVKAFTPPEPPKAPTPPSDLPLSERIAQATRYFDRVPGAVEGDGGDLATWNAALKVIGFDLPYSEELRVLRVWNARCDPPWADDALERKLVEARAKSGASRGSLLKAPQVQATGPTRTRTLTDTGNAERLVDQHGDFIRWCSGLDWLTWDGRRWEKDGKRRVYSMAKRTVRRIYGESETVDDPDVRKAIAKHATRSESAGAREAMVSLARSENRVAVDVSELDSDPWLLNVMNGTLDLKSGRLLPHDSKLLITKLAPVRYVPTATAPTWLAFLERVLPDPEVRAFVQRFIGYCLTGVIREHVLPVFYGHGANGKTTLLEAVREALGDYAVQASPLLLMAKTSDQHPTDRMTLLGRRLAVCSETEADRAFAEVLLKQLTGGDTINARFMRCDEINFKPTHKLVLATNHRPKVKDTSEGIWRRLLLVPFNVTIPEAERDATLAERLRLEATGILTWAVEGCRAWQRDGLKPPAAVRDATLEYRLSEDVIGQFIADHCYVTPGQADTVRARAGDLFAAFKVWCSETGTPETSQKVFGIAMLEKGFGRTKDRRGAVTYIGIRLKMPSELEPEAVPEAERGSK